jgi:hypothetical protein
MWSTSPIVEGSFVADGSAAHRQRGTATLEAMGGEMRSRPSEDLDEFEVTFDDEDATRRHSSVNLIAYARETEALLARGADVASARVLVAPEAASDPNAFAFRRDGLPVEATLVLAVSDEDLALFRLERETIMLVRAIDGCSSLREVIARAEMPLVDGIKHACTLLELGIAIVRGPEGGR